MAGGQRQEPEPTGIEGPVAGITGDGVMPIEGRVFVQAGFGLEHPQDYPRSRAMHLRISAITAPSANSRPGTTSSAATR
jgi:hypothetical protein